MAIESTDMKRALVINPNFIADTYAEVEAIMNDHVGEYFYISESSDVWRVEVDRGVPYLRRIAVGRISFDEMPTDIGAGDGGGSTFNAVAGVDIARYKILSSNGVGQAILASSDDITHVGRILGVADHSAQVGQTLKVKTIGELKNVTWNWTARHPLFLGLNGDFTQNPLTGTHTVQVGYAVNSTTILLNIGHPIIRT